MSLRTDCDDYRRIEAALNFLQENRQEQPELGTLAKQLTLSEFQTQRLFTRWAESAPSDSCSFLASNMHDNCCSSNARCWKSPPNLDCPVAGACTTWS